MLIYNKDSRHGFWEIESESIHACITDIPYGIDYSSWDILHNNTNSALGGASPAQEGKGVFKSRGKPKNGWSKSDGVRGKEFMDFYKPVLMDLLRVLKPGSPLVVFTGRQYQHNFVTVAEECGFILKDILCWDKVTAPFRAQNIGRVLEKRGVQYTGNDRLGSPRPRFEPIVWLFKPYPIGGTLTDCFLENGVGCFDSEFLMDNIITYPSKIINRIHETEKPVGLLEILTQAFTKTGHTILDPFCGSASQAVACMNLGRNFVGYESDPVMYEKSMGKLNIGTA